MTVVSLNGLSDHDTSLSPEDHTTALVHTAWAGWYYEGSDQHGMDSAA